MKKDRRDIPVGRGARDKRHRDKTKNDENEAVLKELDEQFKGGSLIITYRPVKLKRGRDKKMNYPEILAILPPENEESLMRIQVSESPPEVQVGEVKYVDIPVLGTSITRSPNTLRFIQVKEGGDVKIFELHTPMIM